MIAPDVLRSCVAGAMPLADSLFGKLRAGTADGEGVSREPYGPGEQFAHDLIAASGRELELEIATDVAGNLYLTLPGKDRSLPGWITGSHLDSVPVAGNYDGAAGVIAGLAVLAGFRQVGYTPARDVTVMGIRAEELSSWYGGNHMGHIGSRAALGVLNPADLTEAISARTRKTLAEQMRTAGFDPNAIATAKPHLRTERYCGYLELHIEQGPVLEQRGIPVGIVTGIRGSARARSARCIGAYTHSGAVPHEYRSDAVLATVALLRGLDDAWAEVRAQGGDLVFTVGLLYTDAAVHAITKVPGETSFSIDLRSQDMATLQTMTQRAHALAKSLGHERRVRFELGKFDWQTPARMDSTLQTAFAEGAQALGIPCSSLPSGAGHDAQDFAQAGFPSAMVFVRNANGSHNPHEAMDMNDFCRATQVLAWALVR